METKEKKDKNILSQMTNFLQKYLLKNQGIFFKFFLGKCCHYLGYLKVFCHSVAVWRNL
jgi:hypothetical protein